MANESFTVFDNYPFKNQSNRYDLPSMGKVVGISQSVANFRALIANGEDATSPYSWSKKEVTSHSPATGTTKEPSNGPTNSWSHGGFVRFMTEPNNTSLFASLENAALIKLYDKMSADFKAFTALGELRETISMIKGRALGLRSLVDKHRIRSAIARAKARSLKEWVGTASDLWLEYSFGWKPFISDIQGLLTVIDEASQPLPKSASATYRDTIKRAVVELNTSFPTSGSQVLQTTYQQRVVEFGINWTVGYKFLAASSAGIDSNNVVRLGISPQELVATGWELLPWSFLLDYFGTIGGFLNATVVASMTDINWGSKSLFSRTDTQLWTRSKRDPVATGYIVTVNREGFASIVKTEYSRTKTKPGLPKIQFKSTKLSTSQGLNLAALTGSALADSRYKPPRR
jgi:hypothetical protein